MTQYDMDTIRANRLAAFILACGPEPFEWQFARIHQLAEAYLNKFSGDQDVLLQVEGLS